MIQPIRAVLVTSPGPRSQRLARTLRRHGFRPVATPMIRIEPVSQQPFSLAPSWLPETDLVVFISPNAVKHGAASVAALAPGASLAAVGEATADALAGSIGCADIVSSAANASGGLVSAIAESGLKPGKVCIVRGVGGRELLANELALGGWKVFYLECYRRLPPQMDATELLALWDAHDIRAVLLSSLDAAKNLLRLAGSDGLFPAADYVVASTRIGDFVAGHLGPGCALGIAQSALDEDLVKGLTAIQTMPR